jgi:hypothetical protein
MPYIEGAWNCSYCHGNTDNACQACDPECDCVEIVQEQEECVEYIERCCDVCSENFVQRKDSDIAGRNGQFEKVFLCPAHQGYTKRNN